MISYHFYAQPGPSEGPEVQQYTFFQQADGFVKIVHYIEAIRKRLSPLTRTAINEIGSISADDSMQLKPGHVAQPIPDSYWNLSGATYAYLFGQLASLGIEVIGESQLNIYALTSAIICRGDNGRLQPNYSQVLGSFAATGISNLYRAPGDRTASLTFRNALLMTASTAVQNLMREFVSRKLTPNVPAFANGKP